MDWSATSAKRETVKKYAAIRAELKAKRDYAGLGEAAARRQPDARGEPLLDERPPPRLFAQVRLFASDVPRSGVERFDSRCDESELVKIL